MKKYITKTLAVVLLAGALAGCQTRDGDQGLSKSDLGGLTGAIGGAILGSNIGGGTGNIAAIAGGTLLGAFIGSEIGASLDRADLNYHHQTQLRALEHNRSGVASSWRNPDSGASGTITPTRTYNEGGVYCREYSDTIKIGGRSERAYGRACRQPDGSWRIVE